MKLRISHAGVGLPAISRRGGRQGYRYSCQVVCEADGIKTAKYIDLYEDDKHWYVEEEQLIALIGELPEDVEFLDEARRMALMDHQRRENPYKVFVKVRLDHNADGSMIPMKFKADNMPTVKIEKVLDVRAAASQRAGGQGLRFTCRVTGLRNGEPLEKEIYLFLDSDFWFVERVQLEELVGRLPAGA